jgi:hypothetical protein
MRATVRCLAVASACAAAGAIGSAQRPNAPASFISFTDVAREAGLVHPSIFGGIDRKRYIIETNGAGVALVDVDRDGWLDALVLSGTRLDGAPDATNRLYRNKRDGTFEDITERAGVRRTAWSSSVCAGDYDNDGWIDLFVTAYGQNVLYRNREGRFEDATAAAGLATTGVRWGSGCSFVDLDRDGRLDLFVANYLKFDLKTVPEPGTGPNCLWKGIPVNCGPKGLPTDTNLLYHNDGNGRFSDISERSGIARVTGRYSMTAIAADLTDDGWPDIYVASDSTASILYRNNRDGTFTDIAVESGTAYSEHGSPQAGMGVAVGDYNGDGRLDLAKTHFSDDIPALYRNQGRVRGCGGRGRFARSEPLRTVGHRAGRLRQRRPRGSLLRHRARVSGDRARGRHGRAVSTQGPAHPVPQCRQQPLRGRQQRRRAWPDHAALEPRRRVRRFRQRR